MVQTELWDAWYFSRARKNNVEFSPSSYHLHLLLTRMPYIFWHNFSSFCKNCLSSSLIRFSENWIINFRISYFRNFHLNCLPVMLSEFVNFEKRFPRSILSINSVEKSNWGVVGTKRISSIYHISRKFLLFQLVLLVVFFNAGFPPKRHIYYQKLNHITSKNNVFIVKIVSLFQVVSIEYISDPALNCSYENWLIKSLCHLKVH